MRTVFIFLIIFVLLNKVFNMYFYVIEIIISLYNFYYIYYIEIFKFFKFVMSSNVVLYLFYKHIKFFFNIKKYFFVFFKIFVITSKF